MPYRLRPPTPAAKESFGGMRLLRRADFHVGAHVNTFWRTPCRGATDGPNKKTSAWENKHITWFGEGGSLGEPPGGRGAGAALHSPLYPRIFLTPPPPPK